MTDGERIVVLTGAIPYDGVPHAGGKYLHELGNELRKYGTTVYIAPNSDQNRVAAAVSGQKSILIGSPESFSRIERFFQKVAGLIERAIRIVHPGALALEIAWTLLTNRHLRDEIRAATIIDLQWAEYIALAPIVRLLNSDARLVGTYHDVLSQLFTRRSAKSRGASRLRWRLAAILSDSQVRRSAQRVGTVLTLNVKDASLLADIGVEANVIHPPLGDDAIPRRPSADPVALFVGYFARSVNVEAATWLIDEVWPTVLESVPDATLRIVGSDPDGRLSAFSGYGNGIELAGYVSDLWYEYATARVCVVPLLSGSGVKFKAIEALSASAPTISTSVGAEGIGGEELFTAVTDDPLEFAAAIVRVFTNQERYEEVSKQSGKKMAATFGRDAFSVALQKAYSVPGS